MSVQIILAFVVYFFILLCIGMITSRKQKNNNEYVMGGRSLNYWLTGLSANASDMSAWLFMGLPMAVYVSGLSAGWIAIGLLIGMGLNWIVVAKRLRIATEKYNCCTLAGFFEKRFNDNSGILRSLSAIMMLFFLTHYLAATLTAMGQIFESVFFMDYYIGLTIATVVVVVYTFGGGFVAIAWTDLFQGLFLLAAIIITPFVAYSSMGESANRWIEISAEKEGFLSFFGEGIQTTAFLSIILTSISWSLGYFGMPHILTKFMGIRDPKEMSKATRIGMCWQFLALGAAIAVGIVGAAFFHETLTDPQLTFINMVQLLFNPFVGGLIICGVCAANLSTMDSQLLVCASTVGEDLYSFFGKRNPTPEEKMRITKFALVAIAVTALLISFGKSKAILDTVFYSWTGLGAAFGPIMLMSLYFKKANKYGALTGIIVGGVVAGAWHFVNPYIIDFQIPSMIPAFLLSLLSIYAVSLMTQEKAVQLAEKGA